MFGQKKQFQALNQMINPIIVKIIGWEELIEPLVEQNKQFIQFPEFFQ